MATLSSSLVKKLVSVTNDSSSTATSSGTAYGTVTVSGDKTYVLIDGGTVITPVVAGADARDQDRVIVTIENHTATITSNLTNPASSYTASETEEEITNYLNDDSEDGYLSVVEAYIGTLYADTAYIDTLLANYAQISYLEGDYLSYVEGYIGTLTSDSIIVTNLLANYATIDYLTGDYLEYVDGYISNLTSDYITTEYLTANYITASTIDSQYANIELLNVSTESVKNLFVSVGVLTQATVEDAYITGMLNGVRINADVITAGTLAVDRLLVTGEDSIVYQINVNSSGLSMTELSDEVYQNYLNGTDIVANSITANQIAAGTITASEINTTSLAASEAFLTTLTAQKAFIDAIETNTVVVGAVETAEAAIANQDILYTTTTSALTAPDSSAVWSTVQPDKVSGVYIWMKIINTYGNGTTYESSPVCISGLDGEDGISGASVAISASDVQYAISTSGSTVPTSGWSVNLPTASNGQYLWTRTEITYELTDADGNTTEKTTTSYGVSYIGIDGTDGTSVEISSSSITYCASTNGTTAPTSGSWTTTIPSVSNGQYLWTRTVVTYSTGDTTTSYSVSYIGVDGENGTDGISITSVDNYYALSTSGTVSPSTWSTSVLEMTLTNRYLWNYETKHYSDGSSDSTTPHVIGVYGATGATGEDGVGIAGITEYYAVSSSNSTAPTTWYTTLQTMTVTYKYLWNYETVTYTNGTTEDSIARVIGVYGNTGAKGDTGDAGADGSSVSIYSTEISYIASSSGTTVPSGTWSSSVPSVNNGQYLWTRSVVIYYLTASDGTLTTESTTSYSVAYIGIDGIDGQDGTNGSSFNWNLLKGTATSISTSTTATTSYVTTQRYNTSNTSPNSSNTTIAADGTLQTLEELGFVSGDKVTLSFDWEITDASTYGNFRVEWYGTTSSSDFAYIAAIKNPVATFSSSNTSGHEEITITLTSTTVLSSGVVFRIDNSYLTFKVSNVKLEAGSVASAWCCAQSEIYGEDGTSVSIAGTEISYCVSSSGTTAPSGTWSTSVPSISQGQYLWTRTVVTYSTGDTTTSYGVSYIGTDGQDGKDGTNGADGSSFAWNLAEGTTDDWVAYSVTDATNINPWQIYVYNANDSGFTVGDYLWVSMYVKFSSDFAASGTDTADMYLQGTMNHANTWVSISFTGGNLRSQLSSILNSDSREGYVSTYAKITSAMIDGTYTGTWRINIRFNYYVGTFYVKCAMVNIGSTASAWAPAQSEIYGSDGADGADGSMLYATCTTAAATAAKVATITPTKSDFELTTGTTVSVKFSYTNTASSPTLNVNGTGAYSIYYKGAAITTSYIVASMTLTFCFNGSQWEYTGYVNTDTTDRTQFSGAVKASAAIASGNIIVGNSSGYHQLNAGTSFDISYPILYAGSAISSGSTGTNNYTEINFTVTTTQSITLTAYKYVYIKGTLSASTFTPSSTAPLTQTVPTESDKLYYICLGLAYSSTGIHLDASHEIFMYYGGEFQSLGANSQRIIASWCSANNETLIDGGHIYTGSVDTDQLAANCITTDKLEANCVTTAKLNVGTGGNLYPNYDTFENITDDVLYYSISSSSYVSASLTSEEAWYGTKCCKIVTTSSASSTNYGRVYLGHKSNGYGCIPVFAGTYYRYSCYVKASASASVRVGVLTHSSRSSSGSTHYYTTNTVGTSWQRIEGTFTSASSTYPYISVVLQVNTASVTVYVDAIQIEIVSASSFETSDFAPANTTVIDGGNIVTGSITADKIDVTNLFSQNITFSGQIYATGTDTNGNTYEVYILPGTNTNNDFLVVHNVTSGTYPFYVRANGTAGFGNWWVTEQKIYGGDSTTGVAVMQAPTSSTTYVFAAGGSSHGSYADCPFRVTKKGKLYATGAEFDGGVTVLNGLQVTSGDLSVAEESTFNDDVTINAYLTVSNGSYSNLYVGYHSTYYELVRIGGTSGASPVDNFICYADNIYFRSNNNTNIYIGTSGANAASLTAYLNTISIYKATTFTMYTTSKDSDGCYGQYTIGNPSYYSSAAVWGNFTVGGGYIYGTVSGSSDERVKTDWIDISKYDAFFDLLEGKGFRYTYESSGKYHLGFGAQSVKRALETCGLTEDDFAGLSLTSFPESSPGYHGYASEYGLSYTEFIALIVYEVQQLKAKVQSQAAEIEVLQAQLMG